MTKCIFVRFFYFVFLVGNARGTNILKWRKGKLKMAFPLLLPAPLSLPLMCLDPQDLSVVGRTGVTSPVF